MCGQMAAVPARCLSHFKVTEHIIAAVNSRLCDAVNVPLGACNITYDVVV